MALSEYVRWIRSYVGHSRILLPSASVLIFDDQGRLLVARPHGRDKWVAPGGAVDPGETPADAAIREAFEETGLHIELTGVLGVFGGPDFAVEYSNGDSADYVMTTYTARVIGGSLEPQDGEIAEMRFVGREELDALPLEHWARLVLPHAFEASPDPWWLRPSPGFQRPQNANTTAPASNSIETA
jgi:8-oxo-dGTP pyrophosphatase MutT (NUDIX family)